MSEQVQGTPGEAAASSAPPTSVVQEAVAVPQQQETMRIDPALVMDDVNYEKRYDEMQKEVERESFDPTPHLVRLEGVIASLLQGNCSLSREHQAYFLHKALPTVVRVLTRRRFRNNDDQFLRTNEFFTRVLDLIIARIPNDDLELLETLNRIFDDTRAIYDHPFDKEDLLYARLQSHNDENKTEEPLKPFAVLSKTIRGARFVVYNINYFVNKGGLGAMVKRITTEPNPSVPLIKLHVMAWNKMREFLIQSVQKEFLPQLEVVFSILLGLSDEELRNVKKEDVEEIVRHFESIIREYAPTETYEKTEKFSLAFALKCFRSTNLEKRLHGLSYIEEAISMAQRRPYHHWDDTAYSGYTNPAYRMPQAARWMDTRFLLAWIQENQIVERLFQSKQSDMHPELIKRSKGILRFMASEKFLNQAHLDMMWRATATQHTEPAVFEVLGAISVSLSPEHQNYLLQLIHSIPFAEYSSRTINLIAQFQNTYTSYSSSTEIKLRTMNLLWQIVQDDSKVDQAIADAALVQLCKVLSAFSMRIHRNMLIQIFCDHIRKRVSVYQSIVLLQKVLQEHYSDDKEMRALKGTDHSRQKVLNELKSQLGLVDMLFRELAVYKQVCFNRRQEILAAAAEAGDERAAQATNWNTVVLEGRHPHMKQLTTRLDFIRFVLDFSVARLTRDRADIMWESLVLNALTREEVETTLGWFYRICTSFVKENRNTITCPMVENFFEHRLCKLDVASLSGMGFDCFRRYFCCINAHNGSIRMDGPTDDYLVLYFDGLVGLDQLWNVALGATSEVVFRESMTLLATLYQKVKETRQFNSVRKSFVDRCMKRLQAAHDQLTIGENVAVAQNQIDRLVFMLKNFLQESKLRDEKKQKEVAGSTGAGGAALPPGVQGPQALPRLEPVTATSVPVRSAPQVRPGKEQEVEFLKDMIPGLSTTAAVLAMERHYYNMETALSALMEDSMRERFMAEASRYDAEDAASEQAAAAAAAAAAAEVEEEIAPSKFLFDNQFYFDLLFELLNHDNVDRDRVWEILMELPTNPIIEHTLKTLEDPNWDELINARSLYKMHYCLQIIDRLMSYDEKDTETQTKEKYEWCKLFFYCDGFHHILNLVLHDGFLSRNQSSRAFKSCLRLLLKIIHLFIQGGLSDLVLPLPAAGKQEAAGEVVAKEENNKGRQALLLSTNTGRALIDTIDFPNFLGTMVSIILATCRSYPPHNDDVPIVDYALQLLIGSLIAKPTYLREFYNFGLGTAAAKHAEDKKMTPIEDFIVNATLGHHEQKIRKAASANFHQLCSQYPDVEAVADDLPPPQTFFLDLLLRQIPSEGSINSTCDQFFDLLSLLIERYFNDHPQADRGEVFAAKFEGLFYSTLERIKKHPVQEATRDGPPDQLLIGFFNIARTLLRENAAIKRKVGAKDGLNLIDELWNRCLFPSAPKFTSRSLADVKWKEESKCKTSQTRESCFKLLAELARDSPENVQEILQLIVPNHTKELDLTTWERPSGKNLAGFVGLRNPGCICYMNALLQQIYMTPTLRYGLLSSKAPGSDAAENVLLQLKNMFCHLQHSEMQYYDPSENFCKAFKDRGGNPIDLHMQQDAEEFLRLLCERLEEHLKGTQYEKLLNNFTGVESQILRCPNDPTHFSEREDPISVISIEIKGKANLQEALSFYVQGEQVEWKCEPCGKVVEAALKRLSLKKLPNTLIIHLKRFDFDYETMLRKKLSNLFEFPMELDMEPYTTEGIAKAEARKKRDDAQPSGGPEQADSQEEFNPSNSFNDSLELARPHEYYDYELVGVLVHSGTAEAGHYYSYIKERTAPGSGRWFLFDDKHVMPWDLKDLREECFGGEQAVSSSATSSYSGSYYSTKQPKLKNAYMLFYQRKKPEPEEFPVPDELKQHYLDEATAKVFELAGAKEDEQQQQQQQHQQQVLQTLPSISIDAGSQETEKGKEKAEADVALSATAEGNGAEGQFLTPASSVSPRAVPKSPSIYSLSTASSASTSTLTPSPSIYSIASAASGSEEAIGGGLKRSPSLCFDLSRFGAKDLDSLFAQVIPDEVLQTVWEQNHRVVRERQLFDREYLEFVRDIFALVSLPPVTDVAEVPDDEPAFRVIKSATFFALDTLARAREEKLYISFLRILASLYGQHLPACRWLLAGLMEQHKKWYRFHILDCQDAYVRDCFAELLAAALRLVARQESDVMAKERKERMEQMAASGFPAVEAEPQYTYISSTLNIRFVEHHLALCESTRPAWRRFHQYWRVLRDYAHAGHEERMYLVGRGMIGILMDYYMGEYSPVWKLRGATSRVRLGDSKTSADLITFMEVLSACVCAMETNATRRLGRLPPTCYEEDLAANELAPASPRCLSLLYNREAYVSLIKQGYNVETNIVLNGHLSWEDEERSYWVMDIITSSLSRVPSDQTDKVLAALHGVLQITDSLQQWRIRLLLGTKGGGLLDMGAKRNGVYVVAAAQQLVTIIRTIPLAATFLYRTKEEWKWIEQFLTDPQAANVGTDWGQYATVKPQKEMLELGAQLGRFLAGADESVVMAEWNDELDAIPHERERLTDPTHQLMA